MAEEIAALERTGTWDLVPTSSHIRPITCKWVYKLKTPSDGSLERYKARLVARGFQQEHGHDYDETFASVAHITTVRALLAVASVREWSISQLDVKNVFLNGELREEVYMQPPPGYSVPEGMVCRLRRSLYGLKQAPRAWFQRFASVVTAAGFSAGAHDPALFVHTSSRGRTLLLLYVDDMIITGDDPQFIAFVKARLSEQFLMSDLGPLRYFLGIEVSSTHEGFYLSQEKYIQGLLDRASITDHKTEETPIELNLHLSATDGEPLDDSTRYRHIVGSLVYLGVTRPDISYSVHILSQFISAPTQLHYSHLLRVLRYLHGTMSRRLFFPRSTSLQLQAYCDATWASDFSDRRSLSAYCVFLGGSLIAWKTKKQTAVSRSSTEAELRAMALVTAEVTWLRWLLADFGVSVSIPTPLLTNSTGAISIARDPVKHELTKHIGVDAYYTRAQV
ncbi:hypothetical protein U9M48_020586 [Paspalum notatum var. saurae]|uniref:Reverse transcriptase Ty1/copia-type domain-containing protein n=1 Tax=Paspalum notatum var. saurae TaxID=547442 RepID=A0AAQ3WSS4_PASNO